MSDEVLRPVEVAEWLGIEVGGSLVCRPESAGEYVQPRREQVMGCSGCLLCCVMPSLVAPIASYGVGLVLLSVLLGLALMLPAIGGHKRRLTALGGNPLRMLGDPTITAAATDLTVAYPSMRRPWRIAWTSVRALDPMYGAADAAGCRAVVAWQVETDLPGPGGGGARRSFHVPADAANAEAILNAVRQMLAARQAGRTVFDAASVPRSGLSRLSGADEGPQSTSLSRAE